MLETATATRQIHAGLVPLQALGPIDGPEPPESGRCCGAAGGRFRDHGGNRRRAPRRLHEGSDHGDRRRTLPDGRTRGSDLRGVDTGSTGGTRLHESGESRAEPRCVGSDARERDADGFTVRQPQLDEPVRTAQDERPTFADAPEGGAPDARACGIGSPTRARRTAPAMQADRTVEASTARRCVRSAAGTHRSDPRAPRRSRATGGAGTGRHEGRS